MPTGREDKKKNDGSGCMFDVLAIDDNFLDVADRSKFFIK